MGNETDNILNNLLRLLGTGKEHNINLALQMLSSGIVEWSGDIENAISKATHNHLVSRKFKLNGTFLDFTLKEDKDFFGLSVSLIDQSPTLQYSFLEKYSWVDLSYPLRYVDRTIIIGMGEGELEKSFDYQNGHWRIMELPLLPKTSWNFKYKMPNL